MAFLVYSRHVYVPIRAKGLTYFQASLFVFLVSAFFHEVGIYSMKFGKFIYRYFLSGILKCN